jgi:hypothetical protein
LVKGSFRNNISWQRIAPHQDLGQVRLDDFP